MTAAVDDDYEPETAGRKGHWYALHVRSRHEFVVREQLCQGGIEGFLPLVERLRYWKDRKKIISFPLFPGYLFVRLVPEPAAMLRVLQMTGVVRLLGVRGGQPLPVPDQQVESLKIITQAAGSIDPYPYLREGQMVLIVRGPLAGATGRLVAKAGKHWLVVAVDILQRAVAVKIDAASVQAV
jgi:transcription antitermination factor NusG